MTFRRSERITRGNCLLACLAIGIHLLSCAGLYTAVPLPAVSSAERAALEREIRPTSQYELKALLEQRYWEISREETANLDARATHVSWQSGGGLSPVDLAILTGQQVKDSHSWVSSSDYYMFRRAVATSQAILARKVEQVGSRVAIAAGRPDIMFSLDPSIGMNAGAVAGFSATKIFVGPQIVMLTPNDDGLAFMLAHEVAHHRHAHTRALAIQELLIGAVKVAAGVAIAVAMANGNANYTQLDYQNSISAAATLSGAVVTGAIHATGYERDQEREADYYGIEYMTRAGYNPRLAGETLARLRSYELGLGASWTVPFLSTHPPTSERIVRVRKWAMLNSGKSQEDEATLPWGGQAVLGPARVQGAAASDERVETPKTTASSLRSDVCWTGIGISGETCETCCDQGICETRCMENEAPIDSATVARPAQCWNTDGYDGDSSTLCTTCCTASVTCDTTCVSVGGNR